MTTLSRLSSFIHPYRARLALAAGRRLGGLTSLGYGPAVAEVRPDRLIEQQRCAALLGAGSYDLRAGEVVSEDSRAVGVTISVHVSHGLEEDAAPVSEPRVG